MLLHRNNDKDFYLGSAWSRLSWISPETGFQWMSLPFLGEAFWGTENLGHFCGKFASPIWQNHMHLTFAWGNSEMPLCHYALKAIIMTFMQSNAAWTASDYNNYRGCVTYKHLPPTNEHPRAVLGTYSNDMCIQNGQSTENITSSTSQLEDFYVWMWKFVICSVYLSVLVTDFTLAFSSSNTGSTPKNGFIMKPGFLSESGRGVIAIPPVSATVHLKGKQN